MAARNCRSQRVRPGELRIVTSSLSWIFRPLDRDRGLRGRILAPLQELSDYLNQFAELGIHELLITPLGADRTLEHFMDRFDKEVRPRLK